MGLVRKTLGYARILLDKAKNRIERTHGLGSMMGLADDLSNIDKVAAQYLWSGAALLPTSPLYRQ